MTGITRLDPALLASTPEADEGGVLTRTAELVEFGDGLTAGLWSAPALRDEVDAYPVDETCVIISGTVILTGADGVSHAFGPGESFAIAKGTPLVWEQPGEVRKFYVIRET